MSANLVKFSAEEDPTDKKLVEESLLYKAFLAERDEILKHKWCMSREAGQDVGFEKALLDWIVKHRENWRQWWNANVLPKLKALANQNREAIAC